MSGQGGASSVNSVRMFERIASELPRREREVFEVIRKHPSGITMKEVARELKKGDNVVSGRRKGLLGRGLIRLTGRFRLDSEVVEPVMASVEPPKAVPQAKVQSEQPLLFPISNWSV